MNQITPQEFLDLNSDIDFEVVRSVIDGRSPYDRGTDLYFYLIERVNVLHDRASPQEQIFLEMQIMYYLNKFRRERYPVLLSPDQLKYVTDAIKKIKSNIFY